MRKIQVDEDVFAHLQKHAQALVDTEDSVLRRLLGLDARVQVAKQEAPDDLDQLLTDSLAARRTRAPKADLLGLVKAGFLSETQPLFLVDYQGNRVANVEARVAGAQLAIDGRRVSMSALASEKLKQVGFKGSEVRGPTHWVTAKGDSVTSLWQKLLARRTTRKAIG